MKTRLLIIFAILGIALLLPIQLVYAPPAPDHEAAFDYAEHVIIGKILSVEILSTPNKDPSVSNGFALYEIEIEEYLKNPLGTNIIKVLGRYLDEEHSRSPIGLLYEVDQRVFLYIQKDYSGALVDYDLIIRSHESRVLDNTICGLNATYQEGKCIIGKSEISVDPSTCWGHACIYDFISPLKQFKSGIAIDEIQCKESLTPVTKHDGSPACVKSETKTKLIERGWVKTTALQEIEDSSNILDCNDEENPYNEYECFRDAFSDCYAATVNPEIYTIEGDPIYTTLIITPDCNIEGTADTSTDRFAIPEIINTKCDAIERNQYMWTVENCDANNLPEMQFNFEMQLYPQILECEENGNTWVRENLECVVD